MPTVKQLMTQWEIDVEFGYIYGKGSEHSKLEPTKSICEQSPLSKHFENIKKRSPFDTGNKGLKR